MMILTPEQLNTANYIVGQTPDATSARLESTNVEGALAVHVRFSLQGDQRTYLVGLEGNAVELKAGQFVPFKVDA